MWGVVSGGWWVGTSCPSIHCCRIFRFSDFPAFHAPLKFNRKSIFVANENSNNEIPATMRKQTYFLSHFILLVGFFFIVIPLLTFAHSTLNTRQSKSCWYTSSPVGQQFLMKCSLQLKAAQIVAHIVIQTVPQTVPQIVPQLLRFICAKLCI